MRGGHCEQAFACTVPAVSVSPRMVYFLASLAANTLLNIELRFYAAAFVLMALAALRGIDAQPSNVSSLRITVLTFLPWHGTLSRNGLCRGLARRGLLDLICLLRCALGGKIGIIYLLSNR